ncbi:MAG: site-specific integrase [Candidatus Midichloriaceae bacterium]|jgi:integrase|nr:site-specific integrase [Candidatus Midichloriaceae bacterium]
MKIINFTKGSISSLPVPEKGRSYYKDTKEKGLSLYITSTGLVTFFIRKRVHGKDERIILGNFPEMSVENARKNALKAKALVAEGENPNEEKKRVKLEITFAEMFNQFMERYSKPFKRSWKYDEREVNKFLSHWFLRKASQISKQEIQRLHEQICTQNGLYQANRILERIKAIYNKSIEWGWEGINPANGIKKFKEKSRDRFLQADELPKFFRSLAAEENAIARDYVLLSLLTGARKGNVLSMRWNEISFENKTWRIPETKNGDSLTIPLMGEAMEILKNRRNENKASSFKDSEFVFPGIGKDGHLADPKKAWRRILKRAGIKDARIHDLRRTLGSWQAATGATTAIIGKSLGHKSQQATAIYERLNIDPIRGSMEKATSAMFKHFKS